MYFLSVKFVGLVPESMVHGVSNQWPYNNVCGDLLSVVQNQKVQDQGCMECGGKGRMWQDYPAKFCNLVSGVLSSVWCGIIVQKKKKTQFPDFF